MSSRLYNVYIIFIITVKVIFLILAITNKYLVIKKSDPQLQKKIFKLKEKVEYLFVVLMGILCIVLFNPFNKENIIIDNTTRLLLFIYGFVSLLTSKGMILSDPS